MPSLVTLVFLCSCPRLLLCKLGFVNVVDLLLLECMYHHREVGCAPFEVETDSHDNCLSETEDCVLVVDMSHHLEDGHRHTCG